MKKFRVIFAWIVVSLIVQTAGLLFLDRYFFQSDGSIKSKKVEIKNKAPKKLAKVNIPENAKDIKMSFDGKYLSYEDEGIIKVVNTWDGSINEVENGSNSKLMGYSWLGDRHRMLLGERNSSKGILTLYYYDVSKNDKKEIKEITEIDKKATLDSINASTLTDVTYLKITNNERDNRIYRLDINQKLTRQPLMCRHVGDIQIIPHEDRLLYEDKKSKDIYVTSPNKKLEFSGDSKVKLLQIDSEDNVYVGILKGDKIIKIKYGTLGEKTSSWNNIDLKEPIYDNSIIISQKGEIFYNNKDKKEIINLKDNKEYDYKGEFLTIFDGGFATSINGKLKVEDLK